MNNPISKNMQTVNKPVKTIIGSALVIDAREIFFDPNIHHMCEKMLNVTTAEEALKNYSSDTNKYSLIISNWKLQDKSGIEVLEHVRDINHPSFLIPFILLIPSDTYDELISYIAWANELGVDDIISTPFTMDKIVSKMKLFVEFHFNTIKNRALFHYAATHIFNGSLDEALLTLDSYKTLSPSIHYDHYEPFFRGLAAEKLDDTKKAEQYYCQSITMSGKRNFAHGINALIKLLVKTKRFDEAIKAAEDAFMKSPLNPQWKLHEAQIYLIQKEFKKAEGIYHFLINQNPKYQLYINKMIERFKKEQNIDADQMNNLTDEQRGQIKELSDKAKTYIENNLFDQAIRMYLTMMKIDETDPKKYMEIIASLNYKWYKTLTASGTLRNDYKTLINAIDYTLEILRMDCTDSRAIKLLIKIVQNEKKILNKILEPRISNEVISYVKDHITV